LPQPANISRYGRVRRPNPRYANRARSYEWEVNEKGTRYQDLAHACAIEATPSVPNSNDALSWEPVPRTIRDIVKMPAGTIKEEWLKSVKKELKTLVESGTFQEDIPYEGETSTPVMETFKVKVKSDGSLDKLKTRLVVRGDLQDKNITKDKWSPTASFRSLYLGSQINQLKNYDIELDQSRYCRAIIKKYLDTAGCAKNTRQHDTPLPSGFIPTGDNCSTSDAECVELSTAFNIDFASCIGSLIYLSMTRPDIIFAVNKLAKYTRKPGKVHFEALIHL